MRIAIAAHFLRSGYATQAARDGHHTTQIADVTRATATSDAYRASHVALYRGFRVALTAARIH